MAFGSRMPNATLKKVVLSRSQRLKMLGAALGFPAFMMLCGGFLGWLDIFSQDELGGVIVMLIIAYLIYAIRFAIVAQRNPEGPELEFVDAEAGFRGEFRARFSIYHWVTVFLGALVTFCFMAVLWRTLESRLADGGLSILLASGTATLLSVVWHLQRYRGLVWRYRVLDDASLEIWRDDGWVAVDLKQYGKAYGKVARGKRLESMEWAKDVLLREPRKGAPVLTFLAMGTRSVTLGTRVEGGFVFQYFFKRCQEEGFDLNKRAVSGSPAWVATNLPRDEHTNPSHDPDVHVSGELLTAGGDRKQIELTVDAAELDDDEVLELVESLQQGDHPGSKWAERRAVNIRRGPKP